MSSPCNSLNVTPIKVSKLVRYKNIDADDFILTIESGSALYSRKSTFGDVVNFLKNVTGSYSGSFSGSHWGSLISKNTNASGSFSGSYWGRINSKNTIATGSFSGSYFGQVISKDTNASGSFSGSYWGSVISKNTKATGSFKGDNSKLSGSFRGDNSKLSGSFSGSYWGGVISKNTKATGSFSGSLSGKITGKNSIITGSFRGIDNITNFKGTGKKVSFNGTSSYSVSSSYSATASYAFVESTYENVVVGTRPSPGTPQATGTLYTLNSIIVPVGKRLKWFRIEGALDVSENNWGSIYGVTVNGNLITSNVYSSWGWNNSYGYDPDNGNIITHFTIEGVSPITTGTLTFGVYAYHNNSLYGYVVGYY